MHILNIMLPIILLVITGWSLARADILDTVTESHLNKLVFDVSLPAIIFLSILQNGLKNLLNIDFAIGYLLSIIVTFALTFMLFSFQKKKPFAERVFIGMNTSLSNSGLIAMPILLGIFGELGGLTSAAMLTIASLFIFPFIFFIIEHQISHHDVPTSSIVTGAIKRTLRQPFIMAIIAGAFLSLFTFTPPVALTKYLGYLSDITIPCALIAIGIRLANSTRKMIGLETVFVALITTVVKPIIALIIAVTLHLSKLHSISLLVVSAAPVATSVYILSAKYDIYQSQTAAITFLTMLFSVITLPFYLWIASYFW